MDELACGMWRRAADCWCQRDGSAASALAKVDDELDELHASLLAELASGRMARPVVMKMTLVARFYDRLGDHAVNIARRVIYLAGSAHAPAAERISLNSSTRQGGPASGIQALDPGP
jgi:phosphate transport system protein